MLIVTKNVPREFAHNFPGRTKAAANLRNNETSRVYKGGGKCRFGLSKKEKKKKETVPVCVAEYAPQTFSVCLRQQQTDT